MISGRPARGPCVEDDERALVVLVDDEPLILSAVSRLLAPLAIRVACAHDAETALAAIAAGSVPAAVVSDHNLAGMSGLDLLERVRAIDLEIGTLLHTADQAALRRAQAVGLRALEKGCSPEALRSAVWNLVAPRRRPPLGA